MHKFKGLLGGRVLRGWEPFYQPTLTVHDPNPPITLEHESNITGTGALVAGSAVVAGTGISSSTGTGALAAQAADVTGVAVGASVNAGSFPVIQAASSGNSAGNVTQTTVTNPTGSTLGDLVFVQVANDSDDAPTINAASTGWLQVLTGTHGTVFRTTYYYKKLTGSGDTLILDHASEGVAWTAYRITGFSTVTIFGQPGTDANPDPVSLSPGTGAIARLWLAIYSWDGDISHVSYPANYTLGQITDRWANAEGVGVAMAARERSTTFENPGVATLSASTDWIGTTAAIRSAGLSGQEADVAGVGTTQWAATGALAAQEATVSGSGTVEDTGVTGTGALVAGEADVTGSGITGVIGTGALVAGEADVTGVGIVQWAATGALVAGEADVTGAGASSSSGTGALVALSADVTGSGFIGDAPPPPTVDTRFLALLRRRHWIRRRPLDRSHLR